MKNLKHLGGWMAAAILVAGCTGNSITDPKLRMSQGGAGDGAASSAGAQGGNGGSAGNDSGNGGKGTDAGGGPQGGSSGGGGKGGAGSGGSAVGAGGRATGGTAGTTTGAGGAPATGGRTGAGGSTPGAGGSILPGLGGAPGGPPVLPLGISADKRYMVDSMGRPFLVAGDAPQCLTATLSPTDMTSYFAMRAAQGFNAAWVNLLCNGYTGGAANAATYDGILPFDNNSPPDITKPNAAYFARVDAAVAAAAAVGIVIFLDPIETGGFLDILRSNGMTSARTYGRFLGTRYVNANNIVWMHGNDFRSWPSYSATAVSDDNLVHEVALGMLDTDTRHLQTVELDYPTYMSSLDDSVWTSIININLTYTYYPTYAQLYVDYNRTNHLPNIMIEANYEGENMASGGTHLTNAHDIRTQYYWSNLSGASGSFYGNHWEVFQMANANWKTNFAGDQGAPQMAYVQAVFGARAWYKLVPDQTNVVVTSGFGTFSAGGNAQDNTYATTARTADGTLIMTYIPTARTFAVDMTKLAGAATARWFDPTNGTYTTVTGSPLANTGSKSFTPPTAKHADGYDDWVLILETAPPP